MFGALRDLMPFVQFKKRKKHPWRSVTFSKVAGFSQMIPNRATHLEAPQTSLKMIAVVFFSLYKGYIGKY